MVYLGKNKKVKLSKKQAKALKKTDEQKNKEFDILLNKRSEEKLKISGDFLIPKIVTVRRLSEIINLPATKIIEKLMQNGIMASINESIDFDTAAIIIDEFGGNAKLETEKKDKEKIIHTNLKKRPPVVVILGHVDHGKTTLLDAIRKTDIVSTESGGITQHIGAYQVTWKDKKNNKSLITFLDTPGHEAFSTMRAHGTNITDIAILVVAADDGVKPQTKEAISHIKSANIPAIVAINKIDKPGADADRVKRELSELGLTPEEWGGNTIMIPVSAKKKTGIDNLLDMLIITAEMNEPKAQYDGKVEAVVIESHMQSGIGPVSTVLIKHGTLKVGTFVIIGNKVLGRIRLMEDYLGNRIYKATPSTPVKIAGISQVPNFGDILVEVSNEREAKNIINKSNIKIKKFNEYEASQAIKKGELNKLQIILKADTQGSLEAIKNTIEQLSTNDVKIKIISSGIGNVSENDLILAETSKAIIFGFKVNISKNVLEIANKKNIEIKNYEIIYRLIDDVDLILSGLVKPKTTEVLIGKMEVIKVFYKIADKKLVGGKVVDGKFIEGEKIKIFHSGEMIGEGKIISLQIDKNKVKEVIKGMECGVAISTKKTIKPKDLLEEYKIEEIKK